MVQARLRGPPLDAGFILTPEAVPVRVSEGRQVVGLAQPAPGEGVEEALGWPLRQPDRDEDRDAHQEEDGHALQDPLCPGHPEVPADEDASQQPHDEAPQVARVAHLGHPLLLAWNEEHVGQDVARDQEDEKEELRTPKSGLAPVHDEVAEVHAQEGVAARRHARERRGMRHGHHVEGASPEDADVEDGRRPQEAMEALQRQAGHESNVAVHDDMNGGNVRELVGQPPPNLSPAVLAVSVQQDQRLAREDRLDAGHALLVDEAEYDPEAEAEDHLRYDEPWPVLLH
mmetsp:Transcript_125392/g.304498  ORF Transcript_125392/g.304498 Transcript_125392/m.304498 type:complete len:286 (-) Transcript_125392:629-1486(-)